MTNKTLIAKPVVKNQFWIVTDGTEKVGNVLADGSGFEVKLNGNKTHYKNTKTIKKVANIEFLTFTNFSSDKKEVPFNEYPTTNKVCNSILDIKRKLHLYTKTPKSQSFFCAGHYIIKFSSTWVRAFCPKMITLNRYEYQGPFKTAESMLGAMKEANESL